MSLIHVAGHPALDFLGTVSERDHDQHEELSAPALLAGWYVDAGITTTAPPINDTDLRRAQELREHLYVVITGWMDQAVPPEAARRAVNRAAAIAPPTPALHRGGSVAIHGDADACVAAVAASALLLMRTTPRDQVRWCADQHCTHLFLDTSRAQRRRWCDMNSCGTRNKQRDHRMRQLASGRVSSTASARSVRP